VLHLNKIIALKDKALEEIRRYIGHVIITNASPIESFSIVNKSIESATRENGGEKLKKSLSYEISAEIDESLAESFEKIQR
jgi:hypothetical protein